MGQCVSRKAGTVIAASSNGSPSYRIMDKPRKNKDDSKGASKREAPYTRGTAMLFGFRRRPTTGIPILVNNGVISEVDGSSHQRSKSAGHERESRRYAYPEDEEDRSRHHHRSQNASGRSTPRLAPPKKEASGISVRTNRFGFRQPQPRYTDKVTDVCVGGGQYVQPKSTNDDHQRCKQTANRRVYTTSSSASSNSGSKLRPSPVNNAPSSFTTASNNNNTNANNANNNNNNNTHDSLISDSNDRSNTEPISKYTLHTSHLPQPQYAVRMHQDSNSKIAKTAANQSRKVSRGSKGSSSKEGSGTEDSGVGSQFGWIEEATVRESSTTTRPRHLRMIVNGRNSFDVRDVRDDSTVTEISVVALPKCFGNANMNTGLVRERTSQYQRVINKDNRYTDSVSTTSSEGYDEGLGEEKVYKDRSRSEKKVPSVKSDFSPPSSDDPEYGHGEAMADEYSFSSSDECRAANYDQHSNTIISGVGKISSNLGKNLSRSVMLTIEDPAFAAAAANSTTLIDDETSPVDSLFDSPTASITQSDGGRNSRKETAMERSGNTIEDDGPGTPTNASNSLSLSEGREFFDDEIADQPGLTFDDNSKLGKDNASQLVTANHPTNENSYTLVESHPKPAPRLGKSVENSPLRGRKLSRAGSVDTLSPCESIASDDLMLDYERSDASSYEESTHRLDSNPALHELDDAAILSELEAQGEVVMREWSSLLGARHPSQESNVNGINNNLTASNDNNRNATTESGIGSGRTSRLLRSRSGTESPRSLDSVRTRQISSPLRPPRNIQSPSLDSGDEGSMRLERGTYQYMFQDIVSIKTMLLKLKRVVQESGENGLTRAETLNPFDNSMKNGLFYNLNEGGTIDASTSPGSGGSSVADELSDLRRQVVFLQGQLEDRDRTVQLLQIQMTRYQGMNGINSQCSTASSTNGSSSSKETCNAATQTDKIRPVSAGPSLLQSLPQDGGMGPLVSWSDLWNQSNHPSSATLSTSRTLRRPSDGSSRLVRSRQNQNQNQNQTSSTSRQNDCADKSVAESSSIKKLSPIKDSSHNRSLESNANAKECQNKCEGNATPQKSSIPTPRRLATSSLIPRAARDVSATGRSHNP